MLIKRYGEYILRGRKEAALNAFLWSLVPFMGWLSAVIVSLVTLRLNAVEGFYVLLWAALPPVILALIGYPATLLYGVLFGTVVCWLLAAVLRETKSWSMVLQVGVLLALIVVAVIHGFWPEIYSHWLKLFKEFYADAEHRFALQVTEAQLTVIVQLMAKIATGSQAVALLFIAFFNLLIARWWQALLFNPGGLAQELYNIRLNFIAVIALIMVIIGVVWDINIAWDFLPLLLAAFFVAGLSLVHAMANRSRSAWGLLILYYLILIFLFIYVGTLTVLAAVSDVFVNFREKIKVKG